MTNGFGCWSKLIYMMSNKKDKVVVWVITIETAVEYEDIIQEIHSCTQGQPEVRHHREGLLMHWGGVWSLKLLSILNSHIVEESSYDVSMYCDWKWILIKFLIRVVCSSLDEGIIGRIGLPKFLMLFSSAVPLAITIVINMCINGRLFDYLTLFFQK